MGSGRIDTRRVGLEVGCALARWLTGKEHLHYGLWTGLEPKAANLGAAQEAYAAKLLALLPQRAGLRILDIGGGAGETAAHLIARGHRVEIVVPSAYLAERCRANAPEAIVHLATFEEAALHGPFDVCLFSESFQYIALDLSLAKARGLLGPGGVIVIGDCFRRSDAGPSRSGTRTVGGGHPVDRFRAQVSRDALQIVAEEDVTDAVAPSIDVEQAFLNVLGVGVAGTQRELAAHRPWAHWLAVRVLGLLLGKRRQALLSQRLMGTGRTADAFRTGNCYLLLQLAPLPDTAAL
jgi:SAM-dependent methyltransferase